MTDKPEIVSAAELADLETTTGCWTHEEGMRLIHIVRELLKAGQALRESADDVEDYDAISVWDAMTKAHEGRRDGQ